MLFTSTMVWIALVLVLLVTIESIDCVRQDYGRDHIPNAGDMIIKPRNPRAKRQLPNAVAESMVSSIPAPIYPGFSAIGTNQGRSLDAHELNHFISPIDRIHATMVSNLLTARLSRPSVRSRSASLGSEHHGLRRPVFSVMSPERSHIQANSNGPASYYQQDSTGKWLPGDNVQLRPDVFNTATVPTPPTATPMIKAAE